MEKIKNRLKNLSNLRYIDLSDQNVDRPYDEHDDLNNHQFQLSKTHSLYLANNQLTNWLDIAKIVEMTPILEELVLSSNPLMPPSDEEIIQIGDRFIRLKLIVLGDLHYDWNAILQCSKLWPSIQRMSLFVNQIQTIQILNDNQFRNLKFLSLSKNPITDWNEIQKLGKLSRLETLELPNCRISLIRFKHDDENLFSNLRYLDLSYNQIDDWLSIAELNKLPSLTTLLLKRNPLFDTNPYYHNFNFILALIKRLEKLDREPVKKETRDDAEKYYLRMIYLDYLEQCKDPLNRQKFLDENPCFLDILNKFGEPIVEKKLTKQEQIQQNFLTINIHDEQNPDSSRRFLRKQIPKTMKVTNLKFMLKRLLRMDIFEEFELNVRSINDDSYSELMEDRNDVCTYPIDDSIGIFVQRNNKH
ncbi:tubulin-specific chaperone e-like protein [Dermatophagoides farinae]|nr:tubulin-specific chaperone e-like protein [Dermatophagoides farinae]